MCIRDSLGAIARSAEALGAHGLILPKRRSAPVSATAMKASAGALHHLPVARVGNLASCLDALKREGLWIAGADMGLSLIHISMCIRDRP